MRWYLEFKLMAVKSHSVALESGFQPLKSFLKSPSHSPSLLDLKTFVLLYSSMLRLV